MQRLIKTALLHIEVVGTAVAEGRYDLVGPNGDIILPQVWEQVIKPGWTVTMHMWPFPEKLPGHIKRTEGGPSNNSSRAFDPPPDHPQTNLTEHLDVEGVLKGQGSPMQDNSQTLASDSFNHGHGATPEDIATEKTGLDGPLYQNAESQVSSHNPQNQTRREFFKLDVKTHDNANHDVTHLDGKRFRCRYPRCPQKMVFTLRVAFQQHIALQHFPRYTFHCDLCDRSLRMTRRDKLVSHYKAAHLQAPNSDTIDRQRIDIPCPPRCWFCPRISPSWPEFYQCFMSHCVIEDESERTDVSQPNPASPQSRKHHVTDVPSRGSTRYSRSGLNSAEDIYVHPATMRQHIIAASRESFDDKLSDDSDVRNEETPAEPLISEHASNQDPVRLKPELNTGAAQNSRKQKHPQAHWQAIQDRIKELEEQTTRLNQVQAQHQAAEPASGSPSIQCKVPGCPSSDKIYQSLSSFQRHIESRHHPRETFASANWRGKKK